MKLLKVVQNIKVQSIFEQAISKQATTAQSFLPDCKTFLTTYVLPHPIEANDHLHSRRFHVLLAFWRSVNIVSSGVFWSECAVDFLFKKGWHLNCYRYVMLLWHIRRQATWWTCTGRTRTELIAERNEAGCVPCMPKPASSPAAASTGVFYANLRSLFFNENKKFGSYRVYRVFTSHTHISTKKCTWR